MGAAATLTPTDNFDATIEDNDIVLVENFRASWCGRCRSFAPIFEQTAAEHPHIVFGKVDTEDQQELAATFNIRSIPTLMTSVTRCCSTPSRVRLPKAALDDLIGQVRKLDMNAVRQQITDERTSIASNDVGNNDPSVRSGRFPVPGRIRGVRREALRDEREPGNRLTTDPGMRPATLSTPYQQADERQHSGGGGDAGGVRPIDDRGHRQRGDAHQAHPDRPSAFM